MVLLQSLVIGISSPLRSTIIYMRACFFLSLKTSEGSLSFLIKESFHTSFDLGLGVFTLDQLVSKVVEGGLHPYFFLKVDFARFFVKIVVSEKGSKVWHQVSHADYNIRALFDCEVIDFESDFYVLIL